MKNPYEVIRSRYLTEKAALMERLHTEESNKSLARCKTPKYVFIVHPTANKYAIACAVEEMYKELNVKVRKVNTIKVKPKRTRMFKGQPGFAPAFKKAIVTLEPGDTLDKV